MELGCRLNQRFFYLVSDSPAIENAKYLLANPDKANRLAAELNAIEFADETNREWRVYKQRLQFAIGDMTLGQIG